MCEEKRLNAEKKFPGLTCFSDRLKVVSIESIPGVMDFGWTPPTRTTKNSCVTKETNDVSKLYKALKKVLNYVS